ncbi:MAG: YdcF family protein [Syntrophorhabdaceae bacterium]|nr:YdcF family protein [Syntrophorhabdaceae bacterium]
MKRNKRQYLELPGDRRRGAGSWFLWTLLAFVIIVAIAAAPHLLSRRLPGLPDSSDAIIVLSGGGGRIPEGYKLWKAGAAWDLYILGTGRSARLSQILPETDALPDWEYSRIRIERWSGNTLENAVSAKGIVEEQKYASIILVTSDYHVPRAYYIFRRVLSSDIDISVVRVNTERNKFSSAWRWARRHFVEGWKYWGYRVLMLWE